MTKEQLKALFQKGNVVTQDAMETLIDFTFGGGTGQTAADWVLLQTSPNHDRITGTEVSPFNNQLIIPNSLDPMNEWEIIRQSGETFFTIEENGMITVEADSLYRLTITSSILFKAHQQGRNAVVAIWSMDSTGTNRRVFFNRQVGSTAAGVGVQNEMTSTHLYDPTGLANNQMGVSAATNLTQENEYQPRTRVTLLIERYSN